MERTSLTCAACLLFSVETASAAQRQGCRTAHPLALVGEARLSFSISFIPKSTHSCEHLSTQWFGLHGLCKEDSMVDFLLSCLIGGLPYPERLEAVPYVVTLGSGSWNLPCFQNR